MKIFDKEYNAIEIDKTSSDKIRGAGNKFSSMGGNSGLSAVQSILLENMAREVSLSNKLILLDRTVDELKKICATLELDIKNASKKIDYIELILNS